jgi:hypothetical protein
VTLVDDKLMQKKIKELETQFRKEKTALENRAIKAEGALESSASALPLITQERDQLREKVRDLQEKVQEMEILRNLASEGAMYQSAFKVKRKHISKPLIPLPNSSTFLPLTPYCNYDLTTAQLNQMVASALLRPKKRSLPPFKNNSSVKLS